MVPCEASGRIKWALTYYGMRVLRVTCEGVCRVYVRVCVGGV